MSELQRTIPEEVGVSSKVLVDLYDEIKKIKLPMHAMIMMRHGKIVTNGYWYPYAKELNHIIYSTSKSITALAIGFLIEEGKLSLDDKFVSFFPELITGPLHPYAEMRTIRNLLTMQDGQLGDPNNSIDRTYCDWFKSYLNSVPRVKPGTLYGYSNNATIGLCAVIEKVTGQKMMEYLKPRLFDKLDIHDIYLEEQMGVETGSRGIHCKAEDLAKIGQMMLQGGKWDGEQVVPESWVKAATTSYVNVANWSMPTDGVNGYGYQWWEWRDGGWGTKGNGGNNIIYWPDTDVVLVTNANMEDCCGFHSEMTNVVLPFIQRSIVSDEALPEDKESYERLLDIEKHLEFHLYDHMDHKSSEEDYFDGKNYEVAKNPAQINDYTISKTPKGLKLNFSIGKDRTPWVFEAGFDEWIYQPITFTDDDGWAKYIWRNDNVLEVIVLLKEKLGSYHLTFYCNKDEHSIDFYPIGWRDFNRNMSCACMAFYKEKKWVR